MNENLSAIAIFLGICIAMSVVFHIFYRRYWRACALAAIASCALFQLANYAYLGYLDPFFLIALAVTLPIAFAISAAVGSILPYFRG